MNQQDKKKYIDSLQKNLTKTCYIKCKQNLVNVQQCFETCYQKYIQTTNTVSQSIKNIAYQKNSLIGYKGYPEHNIQSLLNINRRLVDTLSQTPFAIQHQTRA